MIEQLIKLQQKQAFEKGDQRQVEYGQRLQLFFESLVTEGFEDVRLGDGLKLEETSKESPDRVIITRPDLIKDAVKNQGLTYKDLANLVGIKPPCITLIHQGRNRRVKYKVANALSETLGIKLEDFTKPIEQPSKS